MAVQEFRLPDPGEGLVEAEIVTWRVAVGDRVEVNDILVEVETSKSLVELPSPYAGTVDRAAGLRGRDWSTSGGRSSPSTTGRAPTSPPRGTGKTSSRRRRRPPWTSTVEAAEIDEEQGAPGGRVAVLVGYGPRTTEAKRRPRKTTAENRAPETREQAARTFSTSDPVSRRADVRTPLPPDQASPVGAPLPGPGTAGSEPLPVRTATLAKPPVRKLAKDLGVDLELITGTGTGGVITREDVDSCFAADELGGRKRPRSDLFRRIRLLLRRSGSTVRRSVRAADPDQGCPEGDRAGHGRSRPSPRRT